MGIAGKFHLDGDMEICTKHRSKYIFYLNYLM